MNLQGKSFRKLKKSGGFTLIEMLIVVAIIAILVAVSIPLVNSSLNRARTATDAANERAAKAAALAQYMLDGSTGEVTYSYDAKTGIATTPANDSTPAYGQCTDHKNGHVRVTISADGTSSTVKWYNGSTPIDKPLDSEELITSGGSGGSSSSSTGG